ncbi:MAG: Gfo/Idh/MocA family oxidoreductase, partial [Eubacteriales bacterium]
RCAKHIISEKPLCMDINECKEIASFKLAYGQKNIVASHPQYHPVIVETGRLLPDIKKIFHMELSFSMYRTEIRWKHLLQSGGGILRELCGHLIDVSNNWLGDVRSVYGCNKIILPGREVEDLTANIIEYKCGASVYLSANYFERKSRTYNGKIFGTGGEIEFTLSSYDPDDSRITLYTDEGQREVSVTIPHEIDSVYPGHLDSFKKQIEHCIDTILYDLKDDSVFAEMKTMQIIDASYESQRQGRRIDLPLKSFSSSELKECYNYFDYSENLIDDSLQ